MKKYSFIFLILFLLLGCNGKKDNSPSKVHWDRDMCERCKMAISERKYAFEIVNPKNHKVYKFDDIGCGLLWLDEEKIPWKNEAVMWVKDVDTNKWIDAKKAYYLEDSITPMGYGFSAHEKKPNSNEIKNIEQVRKEVFKIEYRNKEKVTGIK